MTEKKLGFGCMRLPLLSEQKDDFDFEQFDRMADLFIENGFTYFDTSFAYHNGKSEEAVRKAVVERHPRESFTIATKFPTFRVKDESEVEGFFAQQLEHLGVGYVDYYLLHTLHDRFYNGEDGKGGVVKKFHLFEHMQKWKEEGKIRHTGFSFHDSPEVLDEILTDHPEVEFVQVIVNYFDWDSLFVQAKACYDVIRKHGKKVVIMEPLKGGMLTKVPDSLAERMKTMRPELSPAVWGLQFAASLPDVMAVLSGMSTLEQVQDNVGSMKDIAPLTAEEQDMLLEEARRWKESGPEKTADFSAYRGLSYHGVSVEALLDAYNSASVMPVPVKAAELLYVKPQLLAAGISDYRQELPDEKLVLNGEDVTARVKTAWDFLIGHAFGV